MGSGRRRRRLIEVPGRPIRVGRHISRHLYDLDNRPCGTMDTDQLARYVIAAINLADQYCAFIKLYQGHNLTDAIMHQGIDDLAAFRVAYQYWLSETEREE